MASRALAVGIVTNVGADRQRRKLAMVGLGGRFDVVVGLDTLGFGKPDPRVFHHACELLGTDRRHVLRRRPARPRRGRARATPGCAPSGSTGQGVPAPTCPGGVTRVTSLAELEAVVA